MADYDEIMRAFALINSIKENIPKNYEVIEGWVIEYHNALDKVEKEMGKSLLEFRVLEKNLKSPVTVGGKYRTGRKGLCCERSILLQKVDAVLTYLQLLLRSEDREIGFRE